MLKRKLLGKENKIGGVVMAGKGKGGKRAKGGDKGGAKKKGKKK